LEDLEAHDMAIAASDLKKYYTQGVGGASDGGAAGSAAVSLGGYRGSGEITSGSDNNVFDDVSGAEAAAGDTEYRCICLKNTHGSLALTSAKVFVSADDANADTTYSIAVERPATAGLTNGAAQTVANEGAAPTVNTTAHNGVGSGISDWVASTAANSYANGVAVNVGSAGADLGVGEILFVWIKRVIGASAAAANAVSFTITLQGETAA
jgi:hypothetical protein